MQRLLISLPDDLYGQVERVYGRNKSKVIAQIFKTELKKREEYLRHIARESVMGIYIQNHQIREHVNLNHY